MQKKQQPNNQVDSQIHTNSYFNRIKQLHYSNPHYLNNLQILAMQCRNNFGQIIQEFLALQQLKFNEVMFCFTIFQNEKNANQNVRNIFKCFKIQAQKLREAKQKKKQNKRLQKNVIKIIKKINALKIKIYLFRVKLRLNNKIIIQKDNLRLWNMEPIWFYIWAHNYPVYFIKRPHQIYSNIYCQQFRHSSSCSSNISTEDVVPIKDQEKDFLIGKYKKELNQQSEKCITKESKKKK